MWRTPYIHQFPSKQLGGILCLLEVGLRTLPLLRSRHKHPPIHMPKGGGPSQKAPYFLDCPYHRALPYTYRPFYTWAQAFLRDASLLRNLSRWLGPLGVWAWASWTFEMDQSRSLCCGLMLLQHRVKPRPKLKNWMKNPRMKSYKNALNGPKKKLYTKLSMTQGWNHI